MLEMVLDNILVLPEKEKKETVTASGLVIAVTADTQQFVKNGTVVAVGEGTYQSGVWIKTHMKVDDNVVFKNNTGFPITYQGIEYLVLKEPDILAVVK